MSGNLHVRNLEDELIAKLKRRAARHGRSTAAGHRFVTADERFVRKQGRRARFRDRAISLAKAARA